MTQQSNFLNHPLDIMDDFYQLENEYFVSGAVSNFDAEKSEGKIQWNYHRWKMDWFFNKIDMHLQKEKKRKRLSRIMNLIRCVISPFLLLIQER